MDALFTFVMFVVKQVDETSLRFVLKSYVNLVYEIEKSECRRGFIWC